MLSGRVFRADTGVTLKSISRPAVEYKPSSAADGETAGAHSTEPRARRARPEANIAGRLRFESFLLELSAYFAKAPADSLDRGIELWLEKLARFIGVDRTSLWECDPDGPRMTRRYFYYASELQSNLPKVFYVDFPWVIQEYRQGRIVGWARIPEDVPAAAAAELAHSIRVGTKSAIGIPVQTGTTLYVMTFSYLHVYRKWPKRLVRRLQLVGEIFASALVRVSAERSLLASEARNRAILKALPDLLFVLSSSGVFIECHCAEIADLLMPPEKFMGRTLEEVLPPEMAGAFRAAFLRAVKTGGVAEVEYVLPIRGDERHFEARVVRRDDGALVVVVRNITERHRVAERLRQSEQRFRAAFTHSAIGIALVSLDGHFLEVNAAICRILGYSETELLSTTFQALTYPEDLAPNLACLRRVLAGEISHYELEKRYIHKDGRIIWAQMTAALVRSTANEPLYLVSQMQDISERRQSQIEIERARRELAHVGRVSLVGQLTASLAHELLQPITAVVSNAESGLRAPDLPASSEMRTLLQDVAASGRRAGEIIHNVRGLLRKDRRPHTRIDLNQLVEEVAHVMRSDLLLHQVRLITKSDSANAEISGDRVELQQVLLNLMLNGTEAMNAIPLHERELVVSILVREDAVEFSVQDNGPGSASGDIKRLLEPFFTTKPGGVGMGLSICAEIVRAHKGQLSAENNPGRGMTWRCVLPRD
jgi:PAS domain S-box-containing protein